MKKQTYQTIKSRIAYEGKFISVEKNAVVFPTGKDGIYEVFRKSDFSLVIPKRGDVFILVGQYRYPTGAYSIEFPQGGKSAGEESFEVCAKRELREETGYRAEKLEYLGDHYPCQSLSKMKYSIFLCEELSYSTTLRDDSEFGMDLITLSYKELLQKISSNEIVDAPTVAAFCLFCIKKGIPPIQI